MNEKKSLLSKKLFLIAIPIVIIIVIYLVLVFPWPSSSKVAGTMGGDDGVQRAQKYRAGQMTEADVVLKNPEFQKIVQTDEFQKLLKNEEFIKFASSGNLTNLASNGTLGLITNHNFVSLVNMQSFQNLCLNESFFKLLSIPQFAGIVVDKNINYAIYKGEFGKVQSSAQFQALVNSQELGMKNIQAGIIIPLMKSEDYKNVVASQAFNALANNQMFLACLKSGGLDKIPDHFALNAILSLGLQNLVNQQGFANLCISREFVAAAKSNNLYKFDKDYQLGAAARTY
jgi:hypothetical protein